MQGPNIRFSFAPEEYMALATLAQKWGTDIGTVLRVGGMMVLEADQRGLLKLQDPTATMRAVLGKG